MLVYAADSVSATAVQSGAARTGPDPHERGAPLKTLFISLDTVCADRLATLGSIGCRHQTWTGWRPESALFTQAYATDIPTQPSHTAVFTGRYGVSTGIVSHFHPPAKLAEEVAWLPSVFQRRGHHTGAVDHLFAMKEWFIRGYDDYLVPPGAPDRPPRSSTTSPFRGSRSTASRTSSCSCTTGTPTSPTFPPSHSAREYTAGIWHDGLTPSVSSTSCAAGRRIPCSSATCTTISTPIPSLEYIEALHYAEIAYLDHELGRLFDHLDGLGILDECMIVIFGDHGEIMTEHDAWFDHAGLYDSVVHVPLMIRAPGLVPTGSGSTPWWRWST